MSQNKDEPEPKEPTAKQLINSLSCGWQYDPESFLFTKGDHVGYFTNEGFKKI